MRLTGYSVFLAVMSLVACMSCFWAGFPDFGEGFSSSIRYRTKWKDVTSNMGANTGRCRRVCVCLCVAGQVVDWFATETPEGS